PTALCLVFAAGITAALASRSDLRVSPRATFSSRSFAIFMIYLCVVFVPLTLYFYVFHGDWFLLYTFDVRRIPSAIALVGFVFEAFIGAAGYGLGAFLVRSHREALAGVVSTLGFVVALLVPALLQQRLSKVGTFA